MKKVINKRKITAVLFCVIFITACAAVTLAYLTDSDELENTFTVGDVDIRLDETKVTENGTPVPGAERVTGNKYYLLPGHTYVKDPTVTVLRGSESAYVRVKVTFSFAEELTAIFGNDLTEMFEGYDSGWQLAGVTENRTANTCTYEFRYTESAVDKNNTSDTVLPPLFKRLVVPGSVTDEQLAALVEKDVNGKIVDQFKISIIGEAIQADTFGSADEAWGHFE